MDASFSILSPQPASLPYQVSELLALLHQRIDAEFGAVRVEGEVSGFTQARSGHRYFALKDMDGQIRCAWFRSSIRGQPLTEGQKIIAHGRLAVYTPRGDLQLIVNAVEDAGEGALAAAFQRLKKKLQAEGLFDDSRKLAMPESIGHIIIVSSPQAAALQDVLVTLRRRDPFMQVTLIPVPVQGLEAPEAIARALKSIHETSEGDVVLLTRGGGSLEDLQAFNTETVARAIAACPLPVVSAVGHEIDFSISDFVASLRAATPTAAAELLSTDRSQQARMLVPLELRLNNALQRNLQWHRNRLLQLTNRLQRQAPRRRIETNAQRLDSAYRRLWSSTQRTLDHREQQLLRARIRLRRFHADTYIYERKQRHQVLQQRLRARIVQHMDNHQKVLLNLRARLESVNPRSVLTRGYAMVSDESGLITHSQELPESSVRLSIEWFDGTQTGQFMKL